MRFSRSDPYRGALLVAEALRITLAERVLSVVTGAIVATVCAVVLATTGQTVQAERAVLARIDDAGTRSIVITDERGDAHLSASSARRVAALSDVSWAIGLGRSLDAENSFLDKHGLLVPTRVVFGRLPFATTLGDRPLQPGEALTGRAAQHTLGLESVPIGGIERATGSASPIVGRFEASDPVEYLNRGVLIVGGDESETIRSLVVLVEDSARVEVVKEAATTLLGTEQESVLAIETSEVLAQIRAAVDGELGRFSHSLVALVLSVGLILVALTAFGAVTARKQDYGRRRALGASRSAIFGIVLAQYLLIGVGGAGVGAVVGSVLVKHWTGEPLGAAFVAAVGVLAVLATLLAAVIPALVASVRAPVRVLRVP